jgi:hypothetical protein
MKEKDGYRENLEQILTFSNGKSLLSLKDVRAYTGIKDNRTLKKRYPFVAGYISATELARAMSN